MEHLDSGISADGREQVLRPACEPWRAWLLHTFTAAGAVFGFLALGAAVNRHARSAIAWLLLCLLIDGVDGTIARSWNVAEALPQIDGNVLDVIVDFVNCVMVPMAFVWRFDLLPGFITVPVIATAVVTSALWFSRTDMMTSDGWFNGFPTEWNLVIPTLFLLGVSPFVNAGIMLTLAALQLTSVKFVHPMRVREGRAVTVSVTIVWLASIVALLTMLPDRPIWATAPILGAAAYHGLLSVRRSMVGELPEVRPATA